MSYDRLAPTISSKAKKLFGSGNKGQNNRGEAVPLSDGLDTRLCKILDPPLLAQLTKTKSPAHARFGPAQQRIELAALQTISGATSRYIHGKEKIEYVMSEDGTGREKKKRR